MTHSVTVRASSLYEAAVHGLRSLRECGHVPSHQQHGRLEIEVMEPSTRHSIDIGRLERWLDGHVGARDHAERRKLKDLLWEPGKPKTPVKPRR